MKIIRRLFFILGALFVMSATALLALFFIFTNPSHLKTQIVEQIYTQTGLRLHINGEVSWVFSPDLAIRLEQVEFSSIKASQVDIKIPWEIPWQLLVSHQLQIQKVTLQQLSLSVKNIVLGGDMIIDLPSQRLTMQHLTVQSVGLQATGQLSGENIFRDPQFKGQLSMAGGTLLGRMRVTDLTGLPHYQMDLAFTDIDMSQLLKSHILQGRANITAKLNMTGISVAHLNGTVQLTAHDGILNNIDLLQQFRAARQFLRVNAVSAAAIKATHFSKLTASGVIKDGLFTNNSFIVESPDLQATGAGILNLVTQQLKYQLSVKAQGKISNNAYGLSVPLKIEGTLADPKVKIDLSAMTLTVQPTPDLGKQLGKIAHDEIKKLFGHSK